MIKRRSILASTAGLLLAVPFAANAQDWKAKYPEIVMAVVPAENAGA